MSTNKQVVLSECYYDTLGYHDFIFEFLNSIKLQNYECYAFISCTSGYGTEPRELIKIKYEADLIIWVVTDDMCGKEEFNWYKDKKPYSLLIFERICRMYPDKKFILMTEQYELEQLCEVDNLKFVDLPTINFMYDRSKFKYDICQEKNFNQPKQWIMLNANPKLYRISFISYLLSKQLDKFGYITTSEKILSKLKSYNNFYSLCGDYFQFDVPTLIKLNEGFLRLKNKNFEREMIEPFRTVNEVNPCNFIDNYNNNLLPLYKNTKLEIISGGLFFESTPIFSEKEVQSVYGKNFILFLSSPGSVQRWRSYGFDMFDDVINHEYDFVLDPSKRLIKAIEDNIHLLDGSSDLDSLWKEREDRFDFNCKVVDSIQDWYIERTKNQLISKLNEFDITVG
jgi:hypothetical protein